MSQWQVDQQAHKKRIWEKFKSLPLGFVAFLLIILVFVPIIAFLGHPPLQAVEISVQVIIGIFVFIVIVWHLAETIERNVISLLKFLLKCFRFILVFAGLIGGLLAILYGLVRFIKWAWQN